MSDATLVVDSRCTLGEGVVWCERRGAVLWTDIEGARLWMHVPATGATRTWILPDRLGSFALCESGKLLLGLTKGLAFADLDATTGHELSVTHIVPVEADRRDTDPPTRINDGRADRFGNFVFGTMCEDHATAIGSFYQFSPRHGLRHLALDPVAIANSICFSPDGTTMYFADSPARRIWQCGYDADAARVSHVREFANFTAHRGFPDGSSIDADGCLWNAAWSAAMVRRYTPDGRVERELDVPARNPSCLAFGGPNLDELFVTTARQQMKPEHLEAMPHAGGLYRLAPGVRGLPEGRFRDA